MPTDFSIRRFVVAALVAGVASTVVAQDKDKKDKADQVPTAELAPVWLVMDSSMAGTAGVQGGYGQFAYDVAPGATPADFKVEPTAADAGLTFELRNDFIKGQEGKIYVPFQLIIDKDKITNPHLELSSRVAPKGATGPEAPAVPVPAAADKTKTTGAKAPHARYRWDDSWTVDLPATTSKYYRVTAALSVEPGSYDLYIGFRQKPAQGETATSKVKVAVIKKELTVPALGEELSTSSIIVADKVDVLQSALPPERQRDNPYTFGQMKISPSDANKFLKKDDLNIIFWIYGVSSDPTTKKPNVSVDFSFSQKLPSGEKYFNKTEPQELNAATLPPQFDLAAGHQLPGSLQVPLASFPEGEYRLEIKISDKVSGKSISRDVMFTVAPSAVQ
jgi:hypothetical protein